MIQEQFYYVVSFGDSVQDTTEQEVPEPVSRRILSPRHDIKDNRQMQEMSNGELEGGRLKNFVRKRQREIEMNNDSGDENSLYSRGKKPQLYNLKPRPLEYLPIPSILNTKYYIYIYICVLCLLNLTWSLEKYRYTGSPEHRYTPTTGDKYSKYVNPIY